MRKLTQVLNFTSTTSHTAEFDLTHIDDIAGGFFVDVNDPNDYGLTFTSQVDGGISDAAPVLRSLSYSKYGITTHTSKLVMPYVRVPVAVSDLNGETSVDIVVTLVY